VSCWLAQKAEEGRLLLYLPAEAPDRITTDRRCRPAAERIETITTTL
jgi:hypothetical protein